MEKRKGSKRTVMLILLFFALVIMLLWIKACTADCGTNGNVSASGETPVNTSAISDATTAATENATAPTQAETISTEPEAIVPTIETEPSETVPEETTSAVVIPTTPPVTVPQTQPQDTIPPATEAKPTDPPVTEPAHTHSYSATNTVFPTCTTQGYTTFTCTCGSSYQDNVTQATGHSWGAWATTKEATTSAAGEQIRTCSVCGATESQAIAQLSAEVPTDPASCQHSWESKYYPEQGHYGDPYNVCKCGFRFGDPSEWSVHVEANLSEALEKHTNWGSNQDYIIDSPERYEWVCSKCGAVSNTQP